MKKVIVFDLDGVLIDSTDAHAEAFNLAFEAAGLERVEKYKIKKEFGVPQDVLIRRVKPNLSPRKLYSVIAMKDEFILDKTFKLVKPIAGVPDALLTLKNKWKLAIVSNSQHGEIYTLLRAGGIDPRIFDIILGANDIRFPKPSSIPIKKVEETLGSEVEYIVGDQIFDIKMGKAAGKKTIAVLTGLDSREKLGAEDPDVIVRSVALLPEII